MSQDLTLGSKTGELPQKTKSSPIPPNMKEENTDRGSLSVLACRDFRKPTILVNCITPMCKLGTRIPRTRWLDNSLLYLGIMYFAIDLFVMQRLCFPPHHSLYFLWGTNLLILSGITDSELKSDRKTGPGSRVSHMQGQSFHPVPYLLSLIPAVWFT